MLDRVTFSFSIKEKILIVTLSRDYDDLRPLLATMVEAAEGETAVTIAIAGRIDKRRAEVQTISECRRVRRTRPNAAFVAKIVSIAAVEENISTTDKSKRDMLATIVLFMLG